MGKVIGRLAHDVLALGVFFICFLFLYFEALRYWDLGMSGRLSVYQRGKEKKQAMDPALAGEKILLILGLLLVSIPLLIVVPIWAYLLFPRDSPLGSLMGTVSAIGALVGLAKAQRWLLLKIVNKENDV